MIISGEGKKELLEEIDSKNLPDFLGGDFVGDINTNPGPWTDSMNKSFKNKTVKHPD